MMSRVEWWKVKVAKSRVEFKGACECQRSCIFKQFSRLVGFLSLIPCDKPNLHRRGRSMQGSRAGCPLPLLSEFP